MEKIRSSSGGGEKGISEEGWARGGLRYGRKEKVGGRRGGAEVIGWGNGI